MNLTAIENAIRAWVLPASGLPAASVIFAHQNGVSPTPGPAAVISMGDLQQVGVDELRWDFDPSQANGQEIGFRTNGQRTLGVEVTFFAPDATGDAGARAVAAACQAALRLPGVRYALNQAGLGVMQEGPVRWAPRLDGTAWLGQAMLEVQFSVRQSAVERTGYIDTVVTNYGEGPVLQMVGDKDVAGLANFVRWARADQPAFPRLVAGPVLAAGRPGVQFSRLGSDVVSGSARNVPHVRDLNVDPASAIAAVSRETTMAAWIRREALVVLAGVAAPTYRLATIAGAGASLLAGGCYFGLTYSVNLGVLFMSTQTTGNVGGTAISPFGSSFTYTLPQDVWTHVAVTLKKNQLDVAPLEIGATATWFINGALAFTDVGTSGSGTGPRIPQWGLVPAPRYAAAVGAQWSNPFGQFVHGCDGSIADLVLYPRALSAVEVEALYTTGPFGLRV